jgi:hypothetical protein
MRLFTTGRVVYRAKRMSMSENSVSRSEIDVGAALDAVEVATFEADELLNRVLMRTRLPTDRRIEAFQDAAGILHHNYHAMRFVRRAFERRREWPDPSELQTTNLAPLADTLEDIEEAKSHLGLAFFIFEGSLSMAIAFDCSSLWWVSAATTPLAPPTARPSADL